MSNIDDNEISRVVAAFENATIPREEWRHAEHLIVGLYYLNGNSFEAAANRMRTGILNLLAAGFKVDLAKEMPYHETITLFWLKVLSEHSEVTCLNSLAEKASRAIELFDKDYPLRFYSRDSLFSAEARRSFVEPDLNPMP